MSAIDHAGGITIVKDYVPAQRLRHREVFVSLRHDPGHAQVDFGEALAEIAGVERKIRFLRWTCRTATPVLCVDVREPDIEVLGPERRETPPQKIQAALARLAIVPDDRQHISRRGVPARREIGRGPMLPDREDGFDLVNVGGEADAATCPPTLAQPGRRPKQSGQRARG